MKSHKIIQLSRVIWVNESGELHRVEGPAILYFNGAKEWWVDGKKHRIDGPAVERPNGYKEWWLNGTPHKLDGPSCISPTGFKMWHIRGIVYDTEQKWFEALSNEDQISYLFKMEKQ